MAFNNNKTMASDNIVSVTFDKGGGDETALAAIANTLIEFPDPPDDDDGKLDWWGVKDPPSSNKTVTVTISDDLETGTDIIIGAVAMSGVDQTTPVDGGATNSGTSTSASVTVSTATGDLAFGMVFQEAGTGGFGITGATEIWDLNTNDGSSGAHDTDSSSVTFTWTNPINDKWVTSGVNVNQSTGTDHDITPGAGSLSISGKTPTDNESHFITPGNDDLAFTGAAPTVDEDHDITPNKGDLTLTGAAPTADEDHFITPGNDDLAFTGQIPTVNVPSFIRETAFRFREDGPIDIPV